MRGIEELDLNIIERPRRYTGIGRLVARVAVDRQTLSPQQSFDVASVFRRKVQRSQIMIERAVLHHDHDEVSDLLHAHALRLPRTGVFRGRLTAGMHIPTLLAQM
jgi:hypothetical protein